VHRAGKAEVGRRAKLETILWRDSGGEDDRGPALRTAGAEGGDVVAEKESPARLRRGMVACRNVISKIKGSGVDAELTSVMELHARVMAGDDERLAFVCEGKRRVGRSAER
jgi:hypothetical protein